LSLRSSIFVEDKANYGGSDSENKDCKKTMQLFGRAKRTLND